MPITDASPLPDNYGSQARNVNVFPSDDEDNRICLFLNGDQTLVAYLSPDQAFEVAANLTGAADKVRRASDPAYKIQAVLNEVFGTRTPPIQGGVADVLAAAGYTIVKAES